MRNTTARLGLGRLACVLAAIALMVGNCFRARAATFYVAQQDGKAADANPGTESQPWATLSHAAKAIKDGDLVWVKAGTYHETLAPQCDQARFRVFGDDVVMLAPAESPIEASVWHRVAGWTNVFEGKVETQGQLLRVDGAALQFELIHGVKTTLNPADGSLKETPVERQLEDSDVYRWTTNANGLVRLNLAGEEPAQHQLTLRPAEFVGIQMGANNSRNCLVQGFEVRDARHGIAFGGTGNRVEDCVVRGADIGALFGGSQNVLLRCTLVQCWQGLYIADHVGNQVVEETFVLGSGQPVLRNRPPQADLDNPWGPRCSVRFGNTSFNVCRYCVIAEGSWAGWWPDVNCYGNYFYGNLVTRINDRGIYNEYPANDSRILYNAVTDCQDGIISRFCWRTHWMYNYLAGNRDNALGMWGPHLDVPYQFDNVIAKNLVTASQVYWSLQDNQGQAPGLVGWLGKSKASPSALFRMRSNLSANNLFRGKPGTAFGEINGVKFSTLGAFQEATGFDQGSRIDDSATMEDLGLGLYTVRIPETARSGRPAALVGNPIRQGVHVDPLPMAAEDAPYFWKQGDAAVPRGDAEPLSAFGYTYEWPDFGHPVRRLIRYDGGADPCVKLAAGADPQTWLECLPNEDPSVRTPMPAAGSGFWSPSLPTVPGAKIQVSFRLRGKKLKGLKGEPGPVAFVKFQSLTGQHMSRQPLLGKRADGRLLGGELEGDFPWREVRGEVQAPEDAKRFAVFLGLKPAEGVVCFADIHIDTLGEPEPVAPAEPAERYQTLSLAAYANHELDRDVGATLGAPPPGDFERDNCGLPLIDLSRKKAGTYHAGRIPFVVDKAVSLRCFRRPPASLPAAVNGITIGQPARALYLLVAEPLQMGEQEFWRYLVHYADGQSVEVVPVKDATSLFYREPYFLPHGGKPQAALALAAWVGGLGRVLRWVNPRPEVVIQSVDFRSMDAGQAVLLGLTLGTAN